MIVWRISEFATLDGAGGLRVGGRWHSPGRPIVYTANSSALAMLEVLVHLEIADVPAPFQLLKIEVPDGLASAAWDGPPSFATSRTAKWGDVWLADGATALARVPSAIAPGGVNWLVNPAHLESAAIRVLAKSRHPWDRRLIR